MKRIDGNWDLPCKNCDELRRGATLCISTLRKDKCMDVGFKSPDTHTSTTISEEIMIDSPLVIMWAIL